eukprot:Nitzschia sp. Nitz4//scaffold3_size479765//319252//321261//NITZ4_000131-RA/size479765-augustus-gene-1.611-mRNA-1//-1//CDS//3329550851//170//frame0
MFRLYPLLALLCLLPQFGTAEIIELDDVLEATSEEIHYVQGYIDAPGHVDLSLLDFYTLAMPTFTDDWFIEDDNIDDDFAMGGLDDDDNVPSDDLVGNGDAVGDDAGVGNFTVGDDDGTVDDTTGKNTTGSDTAGTDDTGDDGLGGNSTDVDGGNRRRRRQLDEVEQVLDIILFNLPDNCRRSSWGGCDWVALGIGVIDLEVYGGVSYCCSDDTLERGLCSDEQLGRVIIDESRFDGISRPLPVPTSEDEAFKLEDATFDVSVSGDYALILGNCLDEGYGIFAEGTMEWKSVGGYLPGDMFGLMLCFLVLSGVYFLLALWYWCGMRMYQEASIPIQRYILATVVIGFLELFCRSLDLIVWNTDGVRANSLIWMGISLGVFKRAISKCLMVMLSLGWGVIRDSLGMALCRIIILGLVYTGLALARDFFSVIAVNKFESWSASTETVLVDTAVFISLGLLVVNFIFYYWILSALGSTTDYMLKMNQTTKLRRHRNLRCIIISSFVLSFALMVFEFVDTAQGVLTTDQVWMFEATMHSIYLFVLFGVTILWRPNANARDYALQMELPGLGEDGENDLELSCVVPSADDYGNDPDHPSGIAANRGYVS